MNALPWVVGAVAVLGLWQFARAARGDIRGADARRLVTEGARLLDVRTPAEYSAGHLPGAINVPLQTLERRLGDVGARDRAVIVYCASGHRSAHAKRVLERGGFTTVHNLGSIRSW